GLPRGHVLRRGVARRPATAAMDVGRDGRRVDARHGARRLPHLHLARGARRAVPLLLRRVARDVAGVLVHARAARCGADRPARLAGRLEAAWQDRWERHRTFWTPNPKGELTDAEGKHAPEGAPAGVVMDMFPYPSGAGLHVGHPLGYIATDVVARFRRMSGDNVMHALAFDAFGLPAEQYAVQTGQHPRVSTEANIDIMKGQLRRLGLAHDPRRSFATIDPDYVRWTQWIFLQIFNSWYDPEAPGRAGGKG